MTPMITSVYENNSLYVTIASPPSFPEGVKKSPPDGRSQPPAEFGSALKNHNMIPYILQHTTRITFQPIQTVLYYSKTPKNPNETEGSCL